MFHSIKYREQSFGPQKALNGSSLFFQYLKKKLWQNYPEAHKHFSFQIFIHGLWQWHNCMFTGTLPDLLMNACKNVKSLSYCNLCIHQLAYIPSIVARHLKFTIGNIHYYLLQLLCYPRDPRSISLSYLKLFPFVNSSSFYPFMVVPSSSSHHFLYKCMSSILFKSTYK